ncbi:MAG TPA: cytochrome c peroxidase [Lacibacter sp.]|nr:cytochrome c peroxidase [Lacibacter sp.]
MFSLPKTTVILAGCTAGILLASASCKKTGNEQAAIVTGDALAALHLPTVVANYAAPSLPAFLNAPNITAQINTPADNVISDWGATLGRVLFYDKILSINNSISCASCHQQSKGFSDDAVLSKGFNNGNTGRHSMSLVNARYYPNRRFFWDERAATLEQQVLQPIQDAVEMGLRLDTLVNRLQSKQHYPYLFEKAFGNSTITTDRISKALAQFVRSIISYQTKFDTGFAAVPPGSNIGATPFANYTAAENRGKALFFSPELACSSCHGTPTFSAPNAQNNGLDATFTDSGLGGVNGNAADNGKFKVPSLKSVELTAPYMHDGRFATLEQVIEHYNSGVQFSNTLAPQLRNPPPGMGAKRLNLTQQQKDDLLAFLKTLTDRTISTDAKFSNPFK